MRLWILVLTIFLFIACSDNREANNALNENIKAKNKEIALSNEVSSITREAQKLEKQGRDMEIFRQRDNAENARECNAAMEERQKETRDLEARIKNLPENYNNQLTPILADLNECVSCSKRAKESCVKSRAAINEVIKKLYP